MAKRTKDNIKFWNRKITTLFASHPKAQLTEHRWQAVRATMLATHPWIEAVDKKQFIDMLANADYIARKMRYLTEGQQVEIKKQLEQEKIIELHLQ